MSSIYLMLSDSNTYCWFEGLRVFTPTTFLMVQSTAESIKDFKGTRHERHWGFLAAHSSELQSSLVASSMVTGYL